MKQDGFELMLSVLLLSSYAFLLELCVWFISALYDIELKVFFGKSPLKQDHFSADVTKDF